MRKTSAVLICLFLLSGFIGSGALHLVAKAVLADPVLFDCFHEIAPSNDTSSPHGLSPAQVRAIYNLPSTGGNGTIAIIGAYDNPTVLDDLKVFSNEFGLPPVNDTNFEKHMMDPTLFNLNEKWANEESLDVEWAHAIAPNAKILLVEAVMNCLWFTDGSPGPWCDAINYARSRPDVVAISMSWGHPDASWETNYDSYFTSSFGATFFAASGNSRENASYPAASPNVVGVGGTTLNFLNGSFVSETVMNKNDGVHATGGGVSASEAEPSYQVSYGVQASNGHRGVPDVSYAADKYPGYPVYTNYTGQPQWLTLGGTSFGAPQWAAIRSLGLTASNDNFYAIAKSPSYPSCFRDITNGTNGYYNATVGYDFCTGLGSPLTTAFQLANMNACNVYYNDASQNLTTLDISAQSDYTVNVNFTWNGVRTYNVSLQVQVLNPSGSYGWVEPGLTMQFDYLDPGNQAYPVDITKINPVAGTGSLQATLLYDGFNCSAPWSEPVNIVGSNHAPTTPSFVSYPLDGYTGDVCVYTVNATDPDGDNIQYVFNWGDGTANTTLSWRPSGTTGAASHIWNSPGTYTVTAYAYDPYGAWSSKNVTTTIYEGGTGGCPYVYCWNGTKFVKDNNILPASETGNGTDTRDYYMLQQPLVPVRSTKQTSLYSLQIREFESEQDYIDQVKLIAVDHAQGTSIAVSPEGEIVTYQNPASPLSCVDDYGNSRLNEISSMDGNVSDPATYFQGNNGDWLLLDFGRVTAANAKFIFRDDYKCMEYCIDVQVPSANGGWQTVEVLNPRDFWGMEAVNMSAHLPASGDFIVRLLWTAPHRLDYVGLDTTAQAQTTVNSTPPVLAIHSTMGDVTAKLLYDDENCVELVNGQQITLAFTLPNKTQDMTRDFILYTDGYYYTITP